MGGTVGNMQAATAPVDVEAVKCRANQCHRALQEFHRRQSRAHVAVGIRKRLTIEAARKRMPLDLDWSSIRALNGSKRDSFEELCTQLARADCPAGARFVRKGTPD